MFWRQQCFQVVLLFAKLIDFRAYFGGFLRIPSVITLNAPIAPIFHADSVYSARAFFWVCRFESRCMTIFFRLFHIFLIRVFISRGKY